MPFCTFRRNAKHDVQSELTRKSLQFQPSPKIILRNFAKNMLQCVDVRVLSFSAWYGGRRAGFLILVVGAFAGDFFLLPPRNSFVIDQFEYGIGIVPYGVVGLATIAMFEWLRNALCGKRSIGDAVIKGGTGPTNRRGGRRLCVGLPGHQRMSSAADRPLGEGAAISADGH